MHEFDDLRGHESAVLAARLEAAERILADERDREQSLNTRGIAIAAASLVLAGLLGRTVGSVEAETRQLPELVQTLSGIGGAGLLLAAGCSVVVVVLGVLRPSARSALDESELEYWLSDEGLNDDETDARWSLLRGMQHVLASRRAVTEAKAGWLHVAYRFQVMQVVTAGVMLTTLIA